MHPQELRPKPRDADWEPLRQIALRRIRTRLPRAGEETLEDLSQEVLVTLFRLSRREPLADAPMLADSLAQRVCVDHIRRTRGPSGRLDPVTEGDSPLGPSAADAARATPVDMMDLFRFLVLEQFRELDAPCEELASMFYAEQSWSVVAERLGLRHQTVIKRWSRCMEKVQKRLRTQRGPVWEWARSVDRP